MVHRGQTAFAVVFGTSEVNHPQRRRLRSFVGRVGLCWFRAQRAPSAIGNHFCYLRAEDHTYARSLRAGTFKDSVDNVGGQEQPPDC